MERFATMFCTVCGNEIGQGQCFCGTCGSKCHPTTSDTMLQLGEEKEKECVPTFSEFLQNRNSDFDSVTKVKTAERRDRFLPKKKKKQGADLVKINVGIVHIVNGELKIKRSSLMPINVPKSSSSVIVRRAAIDKHKAHNVKLPDTLDWKLLYPDFQEVNNIPGSKHFFTVQKYHESLGKSYQRINLYLCRIEDLEGDHDEEECEDCEDDPTKPLDSSGEVVFNFQARRRRDQETDDIGHNSPNPVLPVDILTSSSASVHVPSTESQEKESEANNIDDPYDLYCSVLYDKKQDLDDDELLLLDEAWIYSEMLGNSANQDPINGSVLLESVLRPLYEKMERAGEDQMQVVRVRRRHIWSDALRAFSKADFHTGVLLSVHFIGEEAADMGGPRREFLRLLMRSLVTESGVLTGSDTRKTFSSSPIHVTQMRYFHAGRMVATSLLQGGPGINCLSPAVYAYFSADVDKCRHLVNVEDIPDLVLQEKVQKIQSLSDDEFEDGVKEAADFLLDLGIAKVSWKVQEKPVLVRVLCEHLVINCSKASLDQFVDGFKSVDMDFFETIKGDSQLFEKVFCFVEEVLTPTNFRHLFNICFSPIGANGREGEELTCLWWEELIDQGTVPLTKILEFSTGADAVPPLGFDKKIDIMFFNQESGLRRYPYASTCALNMFLPRAVESFKDFEELITQAIFDTCGFTKI